MRKILVVDDEPDILKILSKELGAAGYAVLTAATAREGIQKAKELAPDLILMDLILPDMGGAEAVKTLKVFPQLQNTPVIFLTAMIKPDEQQGEPLDINVSEHWYETVAKPYDKQELLSKIQKNLM